MEVVVLEAVLPQIVDLVCEEVIHSIMLSRCCMWSKKKWKKVMKIIRKTKDDRTTKVLDIIETHTKQKILDYAIRLDETIKISNV